jgi:hypothetical protein
MRRLAQIGVLALVVAALVVCPASGVVEGQSPSNYHWARKQFEFTLPVANNVSKDWRKLFKKALSKWNDNGTVTLEKVKGSGSPQDCRSLDGMVQVCSWPYGTQEGWLGLTRLFFDNKGDHVDSVTLQLNDSFLFRSGQYNNDAARQHTICHELGHTMGLDHVDTDSCMNDSQNAVFHNLDPIKKDFRQLKHIYHHKDSTTTVASVKKNDKNKDHKNKVKKNKDEKKNRKTSSEGFFSPTSLPSVPSGLVGPETETVQTLPDGRKVVTFITWADE